MHSEHTNTTRPGDMTCKELHRPESRCKSVGSLTRSFKIMLSSFPVYGEPLHRESKICIYLEMGCNDRHALKQ